MVTSSLIDSYQISSETICRILGFITTKRTGETVMVTHVRSFAARAIAMSISGIAASEIVKNSDHINVL